MGGEKRGGEREEGVRRREGEKEEVRERARTRDLDTVDGTVGGHLRKMEERGEEGYRREALGGEGAGSTLVGDERRAWPEMEVIE